MSIKSWLLPLALIGAVATAPAFANVRPCPEYPSAAAGQSLRGGTNMQFAYCWSVCAARYNGRCIHWTIKCGESSGVRS
ncbi:MAG: hypothetical protein ACT4N4_01150 [Rhodospirillales bacterium]